MMRQWTANRPLLLPYDSCVLQDLITGDVSTKRALTVAVEEAGQRQSEAGADAGGRQLHAWVSSCGYGVPLELTIPLDLWRCVVPRRYRRVMTSSASRTTSWIICAAGLMSRMRLHDSPA